MNLLGLIKEYRKFIKQEQLTKGTVASYNTRLNKFVRFIKDNNLNEDLDDLDLLTAKRANAVSKMRNIFTLYHEYLTENKLSIIGNMPIIKMVVAFANNEYGYVLWGRFKIKRENKIVTVLRSDVMSQILSADTYSNIGNNKYKGIHEVVMLQLLTALRVGDVVKLNGDNLKMYDSGYVIVSRNEKTGEVTTAPIPRHVAEILMTNLKYKRRMFSFKSKHPAYYITSNMRRYVNKLKKIIPELDEYDDITSHMFRRSAISFLLNSGISESHVKSLSGHTPTSKSFDRYVKIDNELILDNIKDAHEKLYTDYE